MSDTPVNNVPDSILTQETPEPQVDFSSENNDTPKHTVKSSDNESFNPDIHATDQDGEPVLTKTGKYRKKPKSRRLKDEELKTEANQTEATKAAAYAATALVFQTGIMLGGDYGYPMKDKEKGLDEEKSIFFSFDKYFASKGITDFPPAVALCVALGGYYGRVLLSKQGKTKMELAVYWLKSKLKRNTKHGARADCRDNGKRENNASDKES